MYAWRKELRPFNKCAHSGSTFDTYDLCAIIVDSLDSLYVIGFLEKSQEFSVCVAEKFALDMNAEFCGWSMKVRKFSLPMTFLYLEEHFLFHTRELIVPMRNFHLAKHGSLNSSLCFNLFFAPFFFSLCSLLCLNRQ